MENYTKAVIMQLVLWIPYRELLNNSPGEMKAEAWASFNNANPCGYILYTRKGRVPSLSTVLCAYATQ